MRTSPVAMTGLAAERTARRVHVRVAVETQRFAQDQLLRGERRRELDHVERPAVVAGLARGHRGRRRRRQIAHARLVHLDAVVDAADPRRAARTATGPGRRGRARPRPRRRRSAGSRARAMERVRTALPAACRSCSRPPPARSGCPSRCARLRATTSAKSRSVALPASSSARAWIAASDTGSTPSGAR